MSMVPTPGGCVEVVASVLVMLSSAQDRLVLGPACRLRWPVAPVESLVSTLAVLVREKSLMRAKITRIA
jgi:hypothetical protein